MIGDEVIPKTEVFSSPDGKQIILLGLRKKSDSFFLEIEITNSGAVKVNPFKARLRLLSVDTLLNPVQASIEALKAGSLAEKKLPLISRLWIGMREGISTSHHLFHLKDDINEHNFTTLYSYTNKAKEHKIKITRIQGSGKQRELESKTISFSAFLELSEALEVFKKIEQDTALNS